MPESSSRKLLGDFELHEEIGRGGMGTVYRAWQRSLQRVVAVKVLRSQVSASSNSIVRFQREAQAAAKLHHPHIVPIFALSEQDGLYYYAMELVGGSGLNAVIDAQRLDQGNKPVPPSEAETVGLDRPAATMTKNPSTADTQPLAGDTSPADSDVSSSGASETPTKNEERFAYIAEQMAHVADALQYAHDQGVIHRDIKPHNLLFGTDGQLRISDFGLARLLEQPGVTVTGELIGSPLYMAPEQLRGEASDPRTGHHSDIYALGATLYEWLTLVPPYPGDTREQVISKILTTEALPLRFHNSDIPTDLETICLKAIDRNTRHRYQTAGDLRDDLNRYVQKLPIHARRAGLGLRASRFALRHQLGVVGAAAVLLAIILGGLLVSKNRQVRTQQATVAEVQAENEKLRDLLAGLPLEVGGALRLAEAAAPVLRQVMVTTTSAGPIAESPLERGANPSMVSTPRGIGRRLVRDFYESVVPGVWPEDVAGHPTPSSPLLQRAIDAWSADPMAGLALISEELEASSGLSESYALYRMYAAYQGRVGSFDAMLASTEKLVQLHPDTAEPYIWRGLARLLTGQEEAGLSDASTAFDAEGPTVWIGGLTGLLRSSLRDYVDAVGSFNGALSEDPEHVASLLGRASIRTALGNHEGAIGDLSVVLAHEPDNADVLALRGDLYVELHQYAAAERDYFDAISIAGNTLLMGMRYIGAATHSRDREPKAPTRTPATSTPTSFDTSTRSAPGSAVNNSGTDWITELLHMQASQRNGLGPRSKPRSKFPLRSLRFGSR